MLWKVSVTERLTSRDDRGTRAEEDRHWRINAEAAGHEPGLTM